MIRKDYTFRRQFNEKPSITPGKTRAWDGPEEACLWNLMSTGYGPYKHTDTRAMREGCQELYLWNLMSTRYGTHKHTDGEGGGA